MRRLVVNADDFGFTRDVNSGILEAHHHGILTATTLMANGAAFDDAVRLARENPSLDVGCHLVLVGGNSLIDPSRAFPASVVELLRAVTLRRVRVYDELRAQVRKIVDAGIRPTHLDTHKHTHLFPPVLDAVARIGEEFNIRWIRRPMDFPLGAGDAPLSKRLLSHCFHGLRGRFHRVLSARGCRTTDHFAGFQITGRYNAPELGALIRVLPEGTTEFMCHPGHCGSELLAARTRLKQSRKAELDALTSTEVRTSLDSTGVQLVGYRDLS